MPCTHPRRPRHGCPTQATQPILDFWGAYGGAKFPKMGDYLPRTPMNHRAKFDAASFILGREIRNRTNTKQTYKQTKQ